MKPLFLALTVFAAPLLAAAPTLAEVHEVRMYNRSDRGAMIYEPISCALRPAIRCGSFPRSPAITWPPSTA